MSRLKGNILLTLAPPGDRTVATGTSRRLLKGQLVWASIGATDKTVLVGELWVQLNLINSDTQPGITLAVLTSGYVTDGVGLLWSGDMPILEGDRVQIQAQSSVSGLQLYGDFRFANGVREGND